MIKFLDLKKQYLSIEKEIDKKIKYIVKNALFIGGKEVENFEESFAKIHNAKYCIGLANGTDAIEIALRSLDLDKNSEVIVPANSFIASSEAITNVGLKISFCDCEKDNYTIDIKDLKRKINKNTKAIIVVHLYGHIADMDKINKIAKKYKLKVIQDCAQAHLAEYKNKKIGELGDISTFSFYPGKNLGAYGDAGAILVNKKNLSSKIRSISNHGRTDKYAHFIEGRNSRLDGIQAGVLNIKLKYLPLWTEKRINLANLYYKTLKDIKGLTLPKRETWAKHSYHLFVIRLKDRDALQEYLYKNNIETGIHYPISLPKQKAYEYLNIKENFKADKIAKEILSLPMGEHLDEKDILKISSQIRKFFNK